ncbi:uridine kinase [Parapedomonas caeni]
MSAPAPFFVAITGGSGSGKSCVSRALVDKLADRGAVLISEDDYYHDHGARPGFDPLAVNFDHLEARDHALLADHLTAWRRGETVRQPRYDFTSHRRTTDTLRVGPAPVMVLEGLHLLASPGLRRQFDLTVYIDVPDDVRLSRRMLRDVAQRGRTIDSVVQQYLATVRPMHRLFTEPGRAVADLVLHEPEQPRPLEASVADFAARIAARIDHHLTIRVP